MIKFIPAEVLKDKFDIFGHFYSVEVAPKRIIECRSVLEIVESIHVPNNTAAISRRKPDAVFIMMNPGSSQPRIEAKNRIHASEIGELPLSLVPTKPDTTQYQVMRLMHYCQWQHVRVLNLSDLRCSKSTEFFKQFRQLEDKLSFDAHSTFSDRRKVELSGKLSTGIPIVCAWGLSPHLDPLINRCTPKLTKAKIVRGLMKEGMINKFLHPLPSLQSQKLQWVNRMVEQCQP